MHDELIDKIKDAAEAMRKAGFVQDEFLYEVIRHMRDQDKDTAEKVQESETALRSIRYILTTFGEESVAEFDKMMKSLRLTHTVFSKQALIYAIRHDMQKWPEFQEAWPEYHKYLYWKSERDAREDKEKELDKKKDKVKE